MLAAEVTIEAFDKFGGRDESSLRVLVRQDGRAILSVETPRITGGSVILGRILGSEIEQVADEFDTQWSAAREHPYNPEGDAASATGSFEITGQQLNQLRQLTMPFTVREL